MIYKHRMEEKSVSLKYFWIVAALFLTAIFVLSLNQIADFDTGYHLKTGEYILQHLTVPLYDIFSYSATGARWIAHYWLADVFFYLVNLVTGFKGLIVFVALLAALTYYIVLKTAWDKTGKSIISLITLFILSYLTLELWVVRPQTFSYLFTAVLIFILERWRRSGNIKLLYWIPGIFVFWANMHAGVILGIAILGAYSLGLLIKRVKNSTFIKSPLIIFLISSTATLLNPNGYKVLTYNFAISSTVQNMGVMEWKSLLHDTTTWQSKTFIALMIISLILVWWHNLRRKRFFDIDWTSLALISGFFVMPLMSIRHIGLFPIATIPLVSAALFDIVSEKKIEIDARPIVWIFSGFLMVLMIIGTIVHIWNRPVVNEKLLPVKAVDFIKANNILGPMFNLQSSGGYLIWRLWPKQPVFIDGRSEVFAGKPDDNLLTVLLGNTGWQNIVNNEYKVNYFIMWYREPTANIVGNWMLRTMSELEFKLAYWDDTSVILARNAPQNNEIINRYAYDIINPFIHPSRILNPYLPQAVTEIKRALSISPDSIILQNYAYNLAIRLEQNNLK